MGTASAADPTRFRAAVIVAFSFYFVGILEREAEVRRMNLPYQKGLESIIGGGFGPDPTNLQLLAGTTESCILLAAYHQ